MIKRHKTWWAVPADPKLKMHLVDVFGATGTMQPHIMACGAVFDHFAVSFSRKSWRVNRCSHCERIRALRERRDACAGRKQLRRRASDRFALDSATQVLEDSSGWKRGE